MREEIYKALFDRLSGSLGASLQTSSRRVRGYESVEPAAQPALFLQQLPETEDGDGGQPRRLHLKAMAYLYAYDTSEAGPMPALNALVDGVQAALQSQPGEVRGLHTTLGGLVDRAWISALETDGGTMGDQAVALITIEMLVH